jgi:hypothetical protein
VTPPLARRCRRTAGRLAHAWGREDGERGSGAVVPTWLKVLSVALVIAVTSLGATPALATPQWGIEMTHANAYGLGAGACPGGKEINVPGEPEKDCGVDPFTGSGTTFAQESGFNTYTIRVKNTSSGGLGAGTALKCEPGPWEGEPAFSYRWLRNGVRIAGAEEAEYTLTADDEGKALQCEVTGTNASGGTSFATKAQLASPEPTPTPPASTEPPTVTEESATVPVGKELTCTTGSWTGNPTFTYQWSRNGAPISGAVDSTYTTTSEDEQSSVQCEVTATNAGGAELAKNRFPTPVGEKEPSPYPAYTEHEPTIPSSSEITGSVSVADQLPEGLVLEGASNTDQDEISGAGWQCTIAPGAKAFTCTRSDSLAVGASYPPIAAHVTVESGVPRSVTNVAAVNGGGAAPADAYDPTTIAAAVPFGIDKLTTSVTNEIDGAYSQAAGHPVAANATFVFNRTVSNRELVDPVTGNLEPTLTVAGGTPKDVEAELPPGLLGNPQNAPQCTTVQAEHSPKNECPQGSVVGFATLNLGEEPGSLEGGRQHAFPVSQRATVPVFNLVPAPGSPAAFEFTFLSARLVVTAKVRSDGDYGVTIDDTATGRVEGKGLQALSLTLCSYGVEGTTNEVGSGSATAPATAACAPAAAGMKPFLTNPARCMGPAPATTLRVDTYQQPANYVSGTVYNGVSLIEGAPSGSESFLTGCNLLRFAPEVEFKPSSALEGGTTQADEPTGAGFALRVPQTNEAGVNATPELKDATVTLPEGMTVDPSAASGLQACSNAQFGLSSTVEPAEPAACPLASQVGAAKVVTPLLEKPLEGQVFLGEPECSPCSASDAEAGRIFRLFLQVRSVERGVMVKLAGRVSANPVTGRLQATFTEQPQLPFGELLLTLNGGPRAPLANPQTCGTATATTDLTPWSTSGLGGLSGAEPIAGTPDATPSSSFAVDSNNQGGTCSGMGFNPSFSAGSQITAAGASSSFAVTLGRQDREQDIAGVTVTTPPGLLGKIVGVEQCPEAQANAGTCGPASEIGSTTVGAGPGPQPFYLGGNVYLTGPYKGAPFGLSIVVPAIAGPFHLGKVVVRAAIAVNPSTAALTIAADPLPQFVDGVQLRLRTINVEIDRSGFMLNPTSCAAQSIGATIAAAQGASAGASTPFEVGGCQNLLFAPKLTASTQARTSKADGASLIVAVKTATGQANISKVDLQLPRQLPARDSTLNKACTEAQFNANPAGCPEGSDIGTATTVTPILNLPLTGPAYLVSHGGAAFPDVELVLQGEGVTIVLDGKTDIKKGITYSRFESVPDAPISSFETDLKEGPHSIFGTDLPARANNDICGQTLWLPTILTSQNGKQLEQTTKVAVTGCKASKPLTRAQKFAQALKQCKKKKSKRRRAACDAAARKKYGLLRKAKKSATRSAGRTGR